MSVLPNLDPKNYQPHALHDSARDWPETNCFVDLWIEVLHARGLAPQAGLGFTLEQDFEGDQFTFFKYRAEDLLNLYGITLQELSIFRDLGAQISLQAQRGVLCLIEVDGFYLPDTRGVSYRNEHTKTTVMPNLFDPANKRMEYFHNAGFYELSGEDFDGVWQTLPAQRRADALYPYVEFAKFGPVPPERQQRIIAQNLLRQRLQRRPKQNPIAVFAEVFETQVAQFPPNDPSFFHKYAFNTLRQLGANFELLGSHLLWLDASLFANAAETAKKISSSAKALQFVLARAALRRRTTGLRDSAMQIAVDWDALMQELTQKTAL